MNIEPPITPKAAQLTKEAVLELSRNLLWQAIVGLIPHRDFNLTVDWVSKKLGWASLDEIDEAIFELEKNNFFVIGPDGKYIEPYIVEPDYLSMDEVVENGFLYANQLSALVTTKVMYTKHCGSLLTNLRTYEEFENDLKKAISTFAENTMRLPKEERTILAALTFNMTNLIRNRSRTSGDPQ